MIEQPESKIANAVGFVLILDGKQVAANYLPLPETYAQADTSLAGLLAAVRDLLARLYEDRARRIADVERQRADVLAQEVARLTTELTRTSSGIAGESP